MGIKFNPFTSEFDFVGTSISTGGGDVVGIPPSDDKAIARYSGTTGKVIQNSKTRVQDSGAIESAGFITNKIIMDTITIKADQVMITDGFSIEPTGELVIEADGELVIV